MDRFECSHRLFAFARLRMALGLMVSSCVIVLLIGGLMSTLSALNATLYSSSRVSFSMGRNRDLPDIFGQIHLVRHTPHWAVIFSGAEKGACHCAAVIVADDKRQDDGAGEGNGGEGECNGCSGDGFGGDELPSGRAG